MAPKIIEISAEDTLKIRHEVMWPDKSIDYVRVPDDEHGKHFGLFLEHELIAVISLFIKNEEAQFRKFATLNRYQGKGYGTLLLQHMINYSIQNNIKRLWCNARLDKMTYYNKFGLNVTDNVFEKGGIKYVIMERWFE